MLCTDDGKSIVVEDDVRGAEYKTVVWRTQVTGIDQECDVFMFSGKVDPESGQDPNLVFSESLIML